MAEKLAEAQAKAADLEHSLKVAASRENALTAENERLLQRLTLQLQAEALVMDSEREQHEARLIARDSAESSVSNSMEGSAHALAPATVVPTPVD